MKFKVKLVNDGYYIEPVPAFKKAGFKETVVENRYADRKPRYLYEEFETDFNTVEELNVLDAVCGRHQLIINFEDKTIRVYNGYNE